MIDGALSLEPRRTESWGLEGMLSQRYSQVLLLLKWSLKTLLLTLLSVESTAK